MTNRQKGALLMCSSAFLFSAMQIAIKMTGNAIPIMEQIFFRNIISLLISFFIISSGFRKASGDAGAKIREARKNAGGAESSSDLPFKEKLAMLFGTKKHQPLLFMRSAFGYLGLIGMFYASANANQGDVTTLMKLSPFMITLWAAIFLKEKIKKFHLPALVLAFVGAAFVANPAFNSNLFPLFMAFLCAVFSSVSYTLLAYFKNKVDGMTIIMHFSTFCCLVCIPFMLFDFVMPDLKTLFLLIFIGVFGGLGQITLTYSYRMAPAAEISIYNYSGIVFSLALGFLFLNEIPDITSLIGCSLVIIAAAITYVCSNRKETLA